MAQIANQIRCPQCGNLVSMQVEQIVDVSLDPASKARLLSGSLNHFQCPACQHEGQLGTPIVYHDPEKELLLTFVPSQIGLSKDDQERLLGKLINQIVNRLPQESRKGYLLQPRAVFTMQGMVERILEADGITREEIEAQQTRMRLFEQLLQTAPDDLETFVDEHDDELDETFFQLATLSIQATERQAAKESATARLDEALKLTSLGKMLEARGEALLWAAEELNTQGEGISRQSLIDLMRESPSDDHLAALARLTRPALDYAFFQRLSEQIEASSDAETEKQLTDLRSRLLEITDELDKLQQARASEAASILRAIVDSADLDQAIRQALPFVDELFMGILHANLRAAGERGDAKSEARLKEVDQRLREILEQSLPESLRLAQKVLQETDEKRAVQILQESSDIIDQQLIESLLATAERLKQDGDIGTADRVMRIHKAALEFMKSKGEVSAAQESG